MALNDNAVLTAAVGYILVGDQDAAKPTPAEISGFDPAGTLPTGFTLLGHTSRDELPEFGFDGGDQETRGSWQSEVLRTVTTEPVADYVTFNLLQFDDEALELYYGYENSGAAGTAEYTVVAGAARIPNKALLVVIVDGTQKLGFYAPRVTVTREDAVTLAVDDFGALPLRATFLDTGSERFSWIGGAIVGNAGA